MNIPMSTAAHMSLAEELQEINEEISQTSSWKVTKSIELEFRKLSILRQLNTTTQ